MDLTRLQARMNPKPDGESAVRHRTGIVDAVNADGTVDLDLGGVVVPDVSVLAGTLVSVGAVVQVLAWAGDLLVIGAVGAAPLIVYARGEGAGAVAINLTTTILLSVSLTIPTDWNTYDIEAVYQFGSNDTSGGSTGASVLIAGFTTLAGVTFGQVLNEEITDTNATDVNHHAGVTFIEGETTTGARPINLAAFRTAAFTVEARRRSLITRAIRTS